MAKKNFIKKADQTGAQPGEVFVNVYGEGKDETDKDIKYFIKEERVDIARLQQEIAREEDRLAQEVVKHTARIDQLKDKLTIAQGV